MNEVYTFLTEKELRDIESMKSVVERITLQTLECSYFIQEYSKNEKFRKLRWHCNITGRELTCLSRDEIDQELVAWDGQPRARFYSRFRRTYARVPQQGCGKYIGCCASDLGSVGRVLFQIILVVHS